MTLVQPSPHLKLSDEAATQAFAGRVARSLPPVGAQGLVIFLSGTLGAGKTSWVRAFLRALGHQGRVRSPSFTIMEPYILQHGAAPIHVYHFDFYRFNGSEEWREAGFDELIGAANSISLIEWPEMAAQSLGTPDLTLKLAIEALPSDEASEDEASEDEASEDDPTGHAPTPARLLTMDAHSPVGETLLRHVLPV